LNKINEIENVLKEVEAFDSSHEKKTPMDSFVAMIKFRSIFAGGGDQHN
jgi:hypothetical protein